MATTRIGSTKRFADNWENIFGGRSKRAAAKGMKTAKSTKEKSSVGKRAKKAKPRRK